MNRDSQRLRLILALLLLTSFTLLTLDYRSGNGGPFGALRKAATSVFGPLEDGISSVTRPVGRFFDDLIHSGRQGGRIRSLQQQVDELQAQLRAQGDVAQQRAELVPLVALAGAHRFRIVPAQVVALGDASGFGYAITLNVGSRDGIRPDMTVISGGRSGGGLVGRVVAVQAYTCVVAVIDDPDVKVGSRLRDDAHVGITAGHGLDPLTFTPTDPVVRPKVGDTIETFGTMEYAPGIPIGTVTSVAPTPGLTTLTAMVRPFIDYTSLDIVGVVVQPSRSAPEPAILPTVTVTRTVTVTASPSPGVGPSGSPAPTGQSGAPGASGSTGPAQATSTPAPSTAASSQPPTTSPPPGG